MEPISFEDYSPQRAEDSYYAGRWEYFQEVIKLVDELAPESVLELGPYKLPIVKGSDTMDRMEGLEGITFRHDARSIPWPMKNKSYDLFIALQVWEHLQGKQREVFAEARRVSKAAILSFPFMWNCPGTWHHCIDERIISNWTLAVPAKKVTKIGDKMIYLFVF